MQECTVCFEIGMNDAVVLPCGHAGICYNCAVDVFRLNGTCCFCRQEVNQVVLVRALRTDAHPATSPPVLYKVVGPECSDETDDKAA